LIYSFPRSTTKLGLCNQETSLALEEICTHGFLCTEKAVPERAERWRRNAREAVVEAEN